MAGDFKTVELPEFYCVVIPWRGFRCFTQDTLLAEYLNVAISIQVVIPWRGFRCFTRYRLELERAGIIPPLL